MKTNMREKLFALLFMAGGLIILLSITGFSSGFSIIQHDYFKQEVPEPSAEPIIEPGAALDTIPELEQEVMDPAKLEAMADIDFDFDFDIDLDIDIDMDDLKVEMEEAMAEMKNIDWEEIRKELEQSRAELEKIDLEQIRIDVEKALEGIDIEEIRREIERAFEEIDLDELRR